MRKQQLNNYHTSKTSIFLIYFCTCLCIFFNVSSASAQDEINYFTGAIPASDEQLETFKRAPVRRAFFPEVVDLSSRFPQPGNQGQQGSCTGWAVGYAARAYYNGAKGKGKSLPQSQIPSPAYLYNSMAGGCCKCGSPIFGALNILKSSGVQSLATYPYSQYRCDPPTLREQANADKFRIVDWLLLRVPKGGRPGRDLKQAKLNMVRQELAFGHPVIFSVQMTATFNDARQLWHGNGSFQCRGKPCGYHAIAVTGYNDRKKRFKFINSWGTTWGKGGYGWMSYDAFSKRVRASYVMRLASDPTPPEPLPTPTPQDFGIDLPKSACGGVIVERIGRRFNLKGFVGRREDVAAIKKSVAGRSDVSIEVEVRPWPQCETLMTLRNVLNDKRKPTVTFPKNRYTVGETLAFDVQMANYQGYLHVAYIQADGKIVNLVQSSPATLQTLSPLKQMKFGDGKNGRPKFTITDEDAIGNEMVIVIASKSPLFDKRRPKVEIERDFLSALRDVIIARPDTSSPERLITADYFVLTTSKGG